MFEIPCYKVSFFLGKSYFVKDRIVWIWKNLVSMCSPQIDSRCQSRNNMVYLVSCESEFFSA